MTRNGQTTLIKQLRRGGAIEHDDTDKESMVNAAHELGMALLVADCDRARSRSAVLRAIAKAVDFPEFFGGNLDALYDCLCDTILDNKTGVVLWLYRLHSGDPALADDAVAIENACADAAQFASENGRVFCYLVEHAGRHPDPEPGVAATSYGEV
ncbi:barstar family protein [Bordetella avium]|uniref:barstar family protein n=1 Tax=Bordetella avium TaxID=521 RepID=UPI000E699282|nr:barstar family protein [Bordetella avium]RIQ35843.1 barstar family protein 2 [Bordetella avium]RIQ39124.1 barstar family protein 2 [Bordetella avium]RIQ40551.1 barstar family protein 2 [Bordetella avium]RIQ46413.1 barstar family protein 2 [Bordetella avium]RIQ56536.1 barstar family protein 2 [Bordetella avium]